MTHSLIYLFKALVMHARFDQKTAACFPDTFEHNIPKELANATKFGKS
jgi:hypothetical protein